MTILFYPDPLNQDCKLFQHLRNINVEFHNDPTKPYDICFYWSYHKTVAPKIEIPNAINAGCYDITKTRINTIFDNLIIDPFTYVGKAVKKGDGQCSKDEILVNCPLKTKDNNSIYLRHIDTFEDGMFTDYRIFYFGAISFICIKRRFGGEFSRKEYNWVEMQLNCIPKKKRNEIEYKCKKFGFDCGEIDVLRDVNTDEFFVIDLNNVSGIAYNWNYPEQERIRKRFENNLFNFLQAHFSAQSAHSH